MKVNIFILLLPVLLLISCATPYQKTGFSGGYSDIKLQENIFKVDFRGNGYTRVERATDLCLLRCAEITLENGYKYFVIVGNQRDIENLTFTTLTFYSTYGTMHTYGGTTYGSFTSYPYGGFPIFIRKPRVTFIIVTFEEKPENVPVVFNAETLRDAIKKKYQIKK
ncbi:hypothetical protein BMS3Abin07_00856 [bacterium BMS3Abin07]|nr:hypothetical protein BMS3Abin07_00856 [bacterium BMS3Abin07]GBE33047.1 hypothetical protein BMS3Bbin05_01979 [bacterium BMS3Bbin05]